jgi:hypothetical protein
MSIELTPGLTFTEFRIYEKWSPGRPVMRSVFATAEGIVYEEIGGRWQRVYRQLPNAEWKFFSVTPMTLERGRTLGAVAELLMMAEAPEIRNCIRLWEAMGVEA